MTRELGGSAGFLYLEFSCFGSFGRVRYDALSGYLESGAWGPCVVALDGHPCQSLRGPAVVRPWAGWMVEIWNSRVSDLRARHRMYGPSCCPSETVVRVSCQPSVSLHCIA